MKIEKATLENNNKRTINKTVTVYTKPQCGGCMLTMSWLDNNNIPYRTIDVTEDVNAMADIVQHEFMGLPVVTVGGFDNAWSGFEVSRLEELL